MQFVTLSENCNRIRRNLLILSTIAIFIKYFNVKIVNVEALGLQLQGFTSESVEILLFVLITYKLISFTWVAIDETRHWIITSVLFRRGDHLDSYIAVFSREFDKYTALLRSDSLTDSERVALRKNEMGLKLINDGLELISKQLKKVLLPFKIRVILWEVSLPIIVGIVALLMIINVVTVTYM